MRTDALHTRIIYARHFTLGFGHSGYKAPGTIPELLADREAGTLSAPSYRKLCIRGDGRHRCRTRQSAVLCPEAKPATKILRFAVIARR